MISNFITPPDLVETVLIIDAPDTQVQALAAFLKGHNRPYNIYLYSHDMDNTDWLIDAYKKSDTILRAEGSTVPVLDCIDIGENQELKTIVHYFNK